MFHAALPPGDADVADAVAAVRARVLRLLEHRGFGSGAEAMRDPLVQCGTCATLCRMPAKNPRVNVVLERPLYASLTRLARRDGTSLSVKARDLLREALETHEDAVLARVAASREQTFDRARSLSRDEVWKAGGKRPRR